MAPRARKAEPTPPPDEAPPETILDASWKQFLLFLRTSAAEKVKGGTDREEYEKLLTILDEHEGAIRSIFASGFMAGVHNVTEFLQEAHALYEMGQQLQHRPERTIPRA